ncbi:MAG: thioredoxin domain-containing protein [bacterium]
MAVNTYEESFSDTLKKLAPALITVGVFILLIVAGFFAINNFLGKPTTTGTTSATAAGLIKDSNPKVGKADSQVKLIYIFDLQCPACKASNTTMLKVLDTYKDKVQFVYKNFPLPIHALAKPAAYAAQAVANQDQTKFFDYKTRVYEQQDQLSTSMLEDVAKSLGGIDIAKFNDDRNSKAVRDTIDKDVNDITSVDMPKSNFDAGNKINSTPSFVLLKDGNVVQWWGGDPGIEEIKARIDKVLQ